MNVTLHTDTRTALCAALGGALDDGLDTVRYAGLGARYAGLGASY